MEQKFLVYKIQDDSCRENMKCEVNNYLENGWLVKDFKSIQGDNHVFTTVMVLIEKINNSTINIK